MIALSMKLRDFTYNNLFCRSVINHYPGHYSKIYLDWACHAHKLLDLMTNIHPGFEEALTPQHQRSCWEFTDISLKLLRQWGWSDPMLA